MGWYCIQSGYSRQRDDLYPKSERVGNRGDFITLLIMVCNLELRMVYFHDFPLNIFKSGLTVCTWNHVWGSVPKYKVVAPSSASQKSRLKGEALFPMWALMFESYLVTLPSSRLCWSFPAFFAWTHPPVFPSVVTRHFSWVCLCVSCSLKRRIIGSGCVPTYDSKSKVSD